MNIHFKNIYARNRQPINKIDRWCGINITAIKILCDYKISVLDTSAYFDIFMTKKITAFS